MTVNTETNKVSYAGNGSTTAFATTFPFFESSHLRVTLVNNTDGSETTQTLTTNYTVTGGSGSTGTVTMLVAPTTAQTLVIRRNMPFSQGTDWVNNDPFDAETLEKALDYAVMRDQQLKEQFDRSLVFPTADSTSLNPILPKASLRASKLLGFDASGNVTTLTASDGSSTFVTAANGTVSRSLAERLAVIVDVTDYGASGDGSDETTEIQAAANALRTLSNGRPGILLFPNVGGTYGVSAPILIPQNCTAMGYGSGRDGSPRTIIKALSGFTSTYTMLHKVSGVQTTYNVAAVLLSYEWTQNTLFCRGFDIQGISVDADYQTDNRGAPVHCVINYGGHVNWTGPKVILGQTLGFGLWHNSLTPNGKWGGSDTPANRATAVACDYSNLRVKNSGGQVVSGTNTPTYYTTHGGTYPYAAIQIGGLLEARDDGTNTSEPSLVTDGNMRSIEIVSKCYGHGLVITRAGGWLVDSLHTNNVGFDGIRFDSGSVFTVTNCYIDGYGCHIPNSYGEVYGINLVGIVGQSTTLNPSPVMLFGCRVRLRPVDNTTSNYWIGFRLAAGSTAGETASAIFMGNALATRNDVGSLTQYFYRLTGGGSNFVVQTIGNQVFEDAYLAGVQYGSWGGGAIREEIEGNSWQYRTAAPSAGFYMTGAKVWNKTPHQGSNTGWVCVTQGSPGTWVQFGAAKLAAVTTAQFDKTNTTLANVTGLSLTLTAGKTYAFTARLYYTADATGGHKYAIAGTATATSIRYQIDSIANATNAFVINSQQTALAGSAGQAGSAAGYTEIHGIITVNAAGTLTVQFAQNAANNTSSILVGSTLTAIEI